MKLSERIRGRKNPTIAGDQYWLWLDELEELVTLETQFAAELNAAKNDYKRIKLLKVANASARAIMQKFVDKVDSGLARSTETYGEMKEWLDE